ncbi:HAMP domain-containing protein [Candidatus Giovannonibacteria bacterium]|nr:HAMP domain-containing protein [Candidatus Giovannonibacteria bacterium]
MFSNFFTNLSIRNKLLFGFSIVVLFFLFFAGYFLRSVNNLNKTFDDLERQYKILSALSILQLSNNKFANNAKAYILTNDKKWEDAYDEALIQYDLALNEFYAIETNGEIQSQVKRFAFLISQLKGTELLILSKVRSGETENAKSLFDLNYEQRQNEASRLILDTVEDKFSDVTSKFNSGHNIVKKARNTLLTLFAVATVGLLLLSFWISSFISEPIKELAETIKKIADGDLKIRARVSSKDEVGILASDLNEMTKRMEKSYQDLEEKVRIRTKDLEDKVTELENLRETMIKTVETLEKIKEKDQ